MQGPDTEAQDQSLPLCRFNLQRTAGPYSWVKIDKTHSEQNETAIPPKLSVKADVAERRIALTIAIGANIKST